MYSDLVRDRKRIEVQTEEVTKDFPFHVATLSVCFVLVIFILLIFLFLFVLADFFCSYFLCSLFFF